MSGTTETIQAIFDLVHANMSYQYDRIVFGKEEFWKSWSKEIKQGMSGIRDDCDGYALTFAELLREHGIAPQHIAICFCTIKGEGHLNCKVFDADQQQWFILDNNTTRPLERSSVERTLGIKWASCMYLNNPGVWVIDQ